ncbi:hypothetical protein [Methanospirillum hungatei]|nr:hypothetical protein [Methanospirillum hungatei]
MTAEEEMKEKPPCRFSWVGALENEDVGSSSVDIQHKTVIALDYFNGRIK